MTEQRTDEPRTNRAAGCLPGLAIGDMTGARFEGHAPARRDPDPDALWQSTTGRYTDDTEMAVALVKELLEHPDVAPSSLLDHFMNDFTAGRGYGPGPKQIFRAVRKGMDPRRARFLQFDNGSLGNGGAMRTAPVGIVHADDHEHLRDVAERQADVTHAHPRGKEGAVLIAMGTALMSSSPPDSFDPNAFLARLRDVTILDAYQEKLEAALDLLSSDGEYGPIRQRLGCGVRALESVPTALYISARSPDAYRDALRAVIRTGGDTDTIGAMAGGMIGARVGLSGLPDPALNALEDADKILDLSNELAEFVRRDT